MPRLTARFRVLLAAVVGLLASLAGLAGVPASASARVTALAPAKGTVTSVSLSAVVTGIAFPAPGAGWALGTASSGTGSPAQIWHTSTAGRSWQVQWQGKGSPLSITATDAAHAWALVSCRPACGRELLGTSDGGAHWHVLGTLPAAVNQVQFVTADLGVAISDACLQDRSLSRCPGRVLMSGDGGTHWTVVLSSATPVFATMNAAGQLWAAQTLPNGGLKSPDARFLTSVNGGRSWQRLGQVADLGPLTPDVQMTLALGAGGTQLSWASIYDPLSCAMHGCGVAALLASTSPSGTAGGQNWSQVNLADSYQDDCGPIGIVFSAASDGAMWASVERNGAACAPPLGLLYSGSGTGWRQLPPWQLSQIESLTAVNQDVAYAISDQGALSLTSDGGQHWAQVLPAPVPTGQVDAVSATSALGAQDANDAGAILRWASSGKGASAGWQQIAELPGIVTQLSFATPRDGIAATYTPDGRPAWRLWASSDGGVSWRPDGNLPAAASADVAGPWLSAGGHGVLLTMADGTPWDPGAGGTGPVREWTTANGGASWTKGSAPPLGKDTLDGPASFSYAGGWKGWLSVANASFDPQIAAFSGGRLTTLPGNPPADGGVQLIRPGTGVAWDVVYGRGNATTLVVARTTDGGGHWARFRFRLPGDGSLPLLGFSNADDGWLVTGATTLRTDNGGRTWRLPADRPVRSNQSVRSNQPVR
jgi:photosystem II stability/assembly factor-like uncharacterized protein